MLTAIAQATSGAPSGFDLKLTRIVARVSATDLAAAIGVKRQQVTTWEASERPSPEARRRYLEGLARIVDGRR